MERKKNLLLILIIILTIIILLGLIIPAVVFWFALEMEISQDWPLVIERPQEQERSLYAPDEVIVEFKPGISEESIQAFYKQYGLREKESIDFNDFSIKVLKISEDERVFKIIELIKNSNLIKSIEPNHFYYIHEYPNDPLYPRQWNLKQINVERAWDVTMGSSGVVVAVIDTGVNYKDNKGYPDLTCWNITQHNAYGGKGYSWWCGLEPPYWNNPFDKYGYKNDWIHDCLSRSFDLPEVNQGEKLTLNYKYSHDLGPIDDSVKLWIHKGQGFFDNWVVREYTGNSGGWKKETIDISELAGSKIEIMFTIFTDESSSDDDGGYNSDGAFFIDEIEIRIEKEEDIWSSIFYDNVDGGNKGWARIDYKKAPGFKDNIFIFPYDVVDNDSYPLEGRWEDQVHGTAVAAIIAQAVNDNYGMAGIAPNVKIMPVKISSQEIKNRAIRVSNLIKGINYATEKGAKIMNISMGGYSPNGFLKNALRVAYEKDIIIVASCGNDSFLGRCSYPANYNDYVIAVGATRYDKERASYSSWGSSLDIMAPSRSLDKSFGHVYLDNITSLAFKTKSCSEMKWSYEPDFGGTSAAAPQVSGVVALLLSENPNLTPLQIKYILESTTELLKNKKGWSGTYGCGLLDAGRALTEGLANVSKMPKDFKMTDHGCSECGNGRLDPDEECDDGEFNADKADACRTDCKLPKCGDGIKDSDEECDDGNKISKDGCSSLCRKENKAGPGEIKTGACFSPYFYDQLLGGECGSGNYYYLSDELPCCTNNVFKGLCCIDSDIGCYWFYEGKTCDEVILEKLTS